MHKMLNQFDYVKMTEREKMMNLQLFLLNCVDEFSVISASFIIDQKLSCLLVHWYDGKSFKR